ncbi:unannotated protein [freshwater metagenome]|uniref:Unannotated protein n=1 Tax=freshwater metagenome TaxID=449393 RepID=A0A6J7E3E8_9ZZZZ|nr:hypothetical protein [Actinomycetota bacterium]
MSQTTVTPSQQRANDRRDEKLAEIEAQIRDGRLKVRRASRRELAELREASRRKAQGGGRSTPAVAPDDR